jgi:hypothetical protein
MHPAEMTLIMGKFKLAQESEIREQKSGNKNQGTEIREQKS